MVVVARPVNDIEMKNLLDFKDLGRLAYRDAWIAQEQAHAEVVDGGQERIFLVEHTAVITLGRRAGVEAHILASQDVLQSRGVEVVQSDRGGDVTFHGPGQLVVYPIIRLVDHQLSVGAYVRCLEAVMVLALADFGITAGKDACAIGVWAKNRADLPAGKIGAIGVRVRRGVTLHGLALNVTTDLSYFDLIVPCGLAGRSVTSMKEILKGACPALNEVKDSLTKHLLRVLSGPRESLLELAVIGEGKPKCASQLEEA